MNVFAGTGRNRVQQVVNVSAPVEINLTLPGSVQGRE